jgi:hypothetical protein
MNGVVSPVKQKPGRLVKLKPEALDMKYSFKYVTYI